MTSQQIGDVALAIYRDNRDDQVRMDRMLREFFAQVREDEFKQQMRLVELEFPCVITNLPSSLPSSGAL
jgi:hypothetical protein